MEINILIDDGLEGCPPANWLESLAESILRAQGVASPAELGLVMVGQARIRQLNWRYLGEDKATDVLAFAMLPDETGETVAPFVTPPDGVKHLGEVIVSYPQAVVQAGEHHHSVKQELAILIIHGVLHLLGFDHDETRPEQAMRARAAEILEHIAGVLD